MRFAAAVLVAAASALTLEPHRGPRGASGALDLEFSVDGARRLLAGADVCPAPMASCATSCFRRKCKGSNRFNTAIKCVANGQNTAWCPKINATAYNASCAAFVADCGSASDEGACYEARCEEKLAAESACTSASGENFWCDDGATTVPTVVPTTAPTASCVEPDAFLPDPVDCSQSSMYDNITAGIFDCARRRRDSPNRTVPSRRKKAM